jgi:hypothetical protein
MSPSPILSPSDEEEERLLTQPDAEADKAEAIDSDEEEERLLTQPPDAEADKAEAIDLTVESEAPNTKRSGPSKRKVIAITPGSKTPNKKKQRSDISDADLFWRVNHWRENLWIGAALENFEINKFHQNTFLMSWML